MANIETYLENIMQARYGRDVRQSIHDGIEAINGDAENAVDIATQAKGEAKTAQDSASAYANQALAHEQQAQAYRDEAEQFKDEAFSGTPEGYEDVVAKVNSLKEHTGTYLAEVGTHEGSALANRIYGMSVQDGTPTPTSPVEIESAKADFKCTGKNLIPYPYYNGNSFTSNGITFTVNEDGSITANGTSTVQNTDYRFMYQVSKDFFKDGYYILSCEGIQNAPDGVKLLFNNINGTTWKRNVATVDRNHIEVRFRHNTALTDYDKFSIVLQIGTAGTTVNNLTFRPMLTLADVDQTYEVNQHTDVTTDLTLRSIEVASTDDYTYERDGKYYIADTIDWSEDRGYEITRRVGHVILDETRSDWYKASSTQYDVYATNVDGAYTGSVNSYVKRNRMLSTHYVPSISGGNNLYVTTAHDGRIYLRYAEYNTTTLEDFKTWIANNHVTVDFILDSYTTEPITSEQAQALLSLKTYDEATSITATSDIEPTINLEYATSEISAKALTGHNEGYIAQKLECLYGVKNLIPYPYTEQSPNRLGITATINDDGSVTFNGTATASYQYVFQGTSVGNLKLNKGNYILSGCPSGGADTGYNLKAVANSVTVTDKGDTKNMNITQDNSIVGVYAYITIGTVCNNLTFKPMLRPASIQSDEYQPYAMSNHELTVLIKQLQTALIEMGGN